jgi:hypothetical protein
VFTVYITSPHNVEYSTGFDSITDALRGAAAAIDDTYTQGVQITRADGVFLFVWQR